MKHVRLIAAAMLLVPSLVFAQAQGRVKGSVTDADGKPIADATVVITCPAINTYRKEMKTDENGIFATLIVDATKQYVFHIEKPGFQAIEQLHKPLIGGQTLEVAFTLLSVDQARAQAQKEALEQPGFRELGEGRELLEAGKTDEARAKFAAAVAVKPDLHVAWHQLATLDFEAGKHADALKEAEKCLEASANFGPCLAVAANAAQGLGDRQKYDTYIAAYKLANPTDPAMLYNDVVPLLNSGNLAEAQPRLEEILEIDPDFADALYQLGIIHINKGEYKEAKTLLDRFLEAAPADHKDRGAAQGMADWLATQV